MRICTRFVASPEFPPIAVTGARTATAVRTPFARFSAVYAPFSQPPDLTLDRLRREGFLHVFTSWKRIATRAGGLYRRGYPIPPPSNTRQPFRITLSHPSAFLFGASPLIVRVGFPHPFPVIPPSAPSSVGTYRTFPFVSFRTLDISCRF